MLSGLKTIYSGKGEWIFLFFFMIKVNKVHVVLMFAKKATFLLHVNNTPTQPWTCENGSTNCVVLYHYLLKRFLCIDSTNK